MSINEVLEQPVSAVDPVYGAPVRKPELGIRVDAANPNHHLWNNNGTWYVHYTLYPTPVTAERVRRSLHTHSVDVARRRRDVLFAKLRSL